MVFSNVTESSITVSWSKPKAAFSSFRVMFTNIVTGLFKACLYTATQVKIPLLVSMICVMYYPAIGESRFVKVESQQSYVVLSKLSAGSSYIITITTTQGRAQSGALTSLITTGTQLDKLTTVYSYLFPLNV